MKFHNPVLIIFLACLASACSTPMANTPAPLIGLTLSSDRPLLSNPKFESSGGGEPRSPDYWLLWNTCAVGNQSEIAKANGGREAGWIMMDDLLIDPGIFLGELRVATCQQGVNLLQVRNIQSIEMKNDAAYILAAQLLAAQLNLGTGSEYCPASDQAVSEAQLLLLKLMFDATGNYLGPPLLNEAVETAGELTQQLSQYNAGTLCVP